MKHFIFGLLAICLLPTELASQNVTRKKIVVKKNRAENESPQNKNTPSLMAAAKFDVSQMLFGRYVIGAEGAIADWFSVDAGIGFTGKNYVDDFVDASYVEYNVEPTYKPGFAYQFKANFFLGDYVFEDGSYLGLNFMGASYRRAYQFAEEPEELITVERRNRVHLVYGINWFLTDKLYIDAFYGIGIGTFYQEAVIQDINSQGQTDYRIITTDDAEYYPDFYVFNIKLGYLLF